MWARVGSVILRYRVIIAAVLIAITGFMGYHASQVSITYEFAKLLPNEDSTLITYTSFKKQFGEDGSVMVIGIDDSTIFQLDKFNAWYDLNTKIKNIDGIQNVASLAKMYTLQRNDSLMKFDFRPLIIDKPQSQSELDSLKDLIYKMPFYEGFIYNKDNNATLMAITFEKAKLNSKQRLAMVDSILLFANQFAVKQKMQIHYSGLPYIRSVIAQKVSAEMKLFMLLAILVTILVLFLFFKSVLPVLVSLIVVLVGMVWAVGCIHLFGYKITILSGLIAPLIIVIGVPNCILLVNSYHTEFSRHHNKIKALTRVVQKAGVSLFFANVTSSIGFGVFCFTHSSILVEFGLVASLNVIGTYIISMLLMPIIFSYLPVPEAKHTKHIEGKRITKLLMLIENIVYFHRKKVYGTVIIVVLISLYGMTKVTALGYMVDDLPKKDPVYVDLNFFQDNFHGVLPFEIVIDSHKEGGAMASKTLYKINKLQKHLAKYDEFSKPLSIVEAIKFSNQAYNDGKRKFYILPSSLDLAQISKYAGEAKQKQSQNQFKSFIDSSKTKTRVSIQMADIGSVRMKKLIAELKPGIDSIFNYDYDEKKWASKDEQYEVTYTGNCVMFLKGTDYLIKNLIESVGIAIILITLVMLTLFMSFRMVVISAIPSLIPLIITAGLMGFFNIHLKPSTILIFSIAFGIASDGTLYFLTKYRQEIKLNNWDISKTVSITIRETGVSMVYTAIILACGFSIFTASTFGGTVALGLLVSVTLLFAYCSNLVLLPAFLLSLEKHMTTKAFIEEPFIEIYNEEEDIDLDNLKLPKK